MTENEHPPEHTEQTTPPTIMVVARDLRLLKLLDMALKLEMACKVKGFASARSAEEGAKSARPDLLILDGQFLDGNARRLSDRLRTITGLSCMPTLLINVGEAQESESHSDHTIMLGRSWNMQELYVAVHELLAL